MIPENVLWIAALIIVTVSITTLFVFFRYWRIKKALQWKPGTRIHGLYFWIAIKLFILTACIYILWEVRFSGLWAFLSIGCISWTVIMLLFVLQRIRILKRTSVQQEKSG
jgi:hypothetical protein